ncbi:MAG: response regulator [Bacteroidota bacterium]
MPTPSTDVLIRVLPYPAVLERAEGEVCALSASFCETFLCDEAEREARRRTLADVFEWIAPQFAQPTLLLEAIQPVTAAQAPCTNGVLLSLADGRTFRLRHEELIERDGTSSGRLWHFHDATESARAAEATLQAEQLAEHAEQVRLNFVSAMSHEIKTPMNAVVGMAHLLAETDLDSGQEELVHALRRSVDHLLDLLTDVLDFSRLETGATTFATDQFDLYALVESVRARYASEAEARDLAFTAEVEDMPRILLGDPTRLEQVLDNLLDNAFMFTHEGAITLRVRQERIQGGRVFCCFDVKDTGIGIDPLQQARLFDPMAHVRAAASAGRTGLGLAIVRQIVEQQGGTVTLVSALGMGSTFTVRLSFPTDEAADYKQAPVRATPAAVVEKASPDALAGYRIMVVDDHPLNRMLVERLLHSWGASVEMAEDGAEAVARAEDTSRPALDLVIMDIQMPVLDGLEATRAIRSLAPPTGTLPILALTAATGTEERDAVFAAGMDDYIGKPFVPEHLLARLRAHLMGTAPPVTPGRSGVSTSENRTAIHHPTVTTDAAPKALPTPSQTLAALDLDLLQVHTMGDEAFAQHLLETFIVQTDRVVAAVGAAHEATDWETVRLLTHKVRPSLRMVGLDRLEAVAHGLDEEADALMRGAQAHPSPDFGTRLDALVECSRAVCTHLREAEAA